MHDSTNDSSGPPSDSSPNGTAPQRPNEGEQARSHQPPPEAAGQAPRWQGTAGPPPGTPPPGWQGSPRPGPMEGFFASVRRTGMVRTDQRWAGGVAGGTARRLGVDPVLVRCVWVVLTLLTGLGLVLYGIGWALLPDERDGRIHLEQALVGDVDAGLAGAIASVVAGVALLDGIILPGLPFVVWDGDGLADAFWAVAWTGALIGLVLWLIAGRRSRRTPPGGPTPAGPPSPGVPGVQPQAPSARPAPGWQQAAWAEGAAAARAAGPSWAPAQPGPYPAGPSSPYVSTRPVPVVGPQYPGPIPPQPRVPGPGRTVSLVVCGLILLGVAALWLADARDLVHPAVAVFLCVAGVTALLGLGVLVSGLRGRRGGWMTGWGWAAAALCLPMILVGTLFPPSTLPSTVRAGSTTLTWQDISAELTSSPSGQAVVELEDYAAGDITIDLTDMPDQALSTDRTVRLRVGAGTVRVVTAPSRPVTVEASVNAGEVTSAVGQGWSLNGVPVETARTTVPWTQGWTVDGERVTWYDTAIQGTNTTARLSTPAAQDAAAGLTVSAELGAGEVEVEARQDAVVWEGNATEDVWVVEGWTDTTGRWTEAADGMAVPGLTHRAVSSGAAEQCLERAGVVDDVDPEEDRELSLTSGQRTSYDACLEEVLADGRGVSDRGASATPGATETPTPSPASPTPQAPAPSETAQTPSPAATS